MWRRPPPPLPPPDTRLADPQDYRSHGLVDPDPTATEDLMASVTRQDVIRWMEIERLVRVLVDPTTTLLEEDLLRPRIRQLVSEGANPIVLPRKRT